MWKKITRKDASDDGALLTDPPEDDEGYFESYLNECQLDFSNRFNHHHEACDLSIDDFDMIHLISQGVFGTIALAKERTADQYYAIKIMEKSLIVSQNKIECLRTEKRLLMSIRHPFIIQMEKYFKDATYIYFLLHYVSGGKLSTLLKKIGRFDERWSIFYAAQMVLALEYLHHLDITYRNLKPENILIDESGQIKLIDFGLAKVAVTRTYSLCGTPEYMAPEIILLSGHDRAVDWWALGVLIFELCTGVTPFSAEDLLETYEMIQTRSLVFPNIFSYELRHLIDNLLQVDISCRLGNLEGGAKDVKKHPWFIHVNWMDIFKGRVRSPYLPDVADFSDTSNFPDFGELHLIHSTEDRFSELFADF